jgi:hypothetical protein
MSDSQNNDTSRFQLWPPRLHLLRRDDPPSAPAADAPPAAVPNFLLQSAVTSEHAEPRSDGASGSQLPPSRYDHPLWALAWTDGRLGASEETQVGLIDAQAELTRQERLAAARAVQEDAAAAERTAREKNDIAHAEWDDADKEFRTVTDERRHDPAAFSRALGGLYGIAAFFILLADLPLSFLVAYALNMRTADKKRGISLDDVRSIFQHADQLWQALAVGLGIAALTIAFKLIIDYFQRPADARNAFIRWGRFILLALVFIATIGVFVIIGLVRAKGADPNGEGVPSWLEQALFTSLALLFPIVAAFCLSMLRQTFQNAARAKAAKKAREKASPRYQETLRGHEEAVAALRKADAALKAIEEDHVEQRFLAQLYLHGYARGWTVPSTRHPNDSLFDRCQRLMHESLARIGQLALAPEE